MLHLTWTVTAMPLISYKTKVLVIALTALLLAPHSMSASIGEVTKQDGQDASIARDADIIIVGPGTSVQMNDAITTSKAKLELTFDDATIVSITRQSKLIIDDFVGTVF